MMVPPVALHLLNMTALEAQQGREPLRLAKPARAGLLRGTAERRRNPCSIAERFVAHAALRPPPAQGPEAFKVFIPKTIPPFASQ